MNAGKSFVQKEEGARLCYANAGGERGIQKRQTQKNGLPVFRWSKDRQKDSISHFFLSSVYFVFYVYLCTAKSALDYSSSILTPCSIRARRAFGGIISFETVIEILRKKNNPNVCLPLKFKKQFKIAIISIMNKLGLLSIQKYIQ